MDRLILLRHGEAERAAVSGEDFDRALNAQGRAESEAVGRMLAVGGAAPDLALVSSAVRAVQTFEGARASFPKAAERTTRFLYLASPHDLRSAIKRAAADARVLMVVGHNPGLHELALDLAMEGAAPDAEMNRLSRGLPTATAVVFDIDGDGRARLRNLFLPKGERP